MGMWREYVPVAKRRANANREIEKLRKKGKKVEAINISGRHIAHRFWGKQWCEHMETLADYNNRLPRGKTYVRNGSVCHLGIEEGRIEAIVSGSYLYKVSITIKTLSQQKWESIKQKCSGLIGSILELLQGKLSDNIMRLVSDNKEGLFPDLKEMSFKCSCPDWADMCKHVAATLYGIASRLDDRPELLFQLRGVNPSELIKVDLHLEASNSLDLLESSDLSSIFDINFESDEKQIATDNQTKKDKKATNARKVHTALNFNSLTGNILRKLREQKNLTVQEFADLLEVSSASIYRWENSSKVLNLRGKSKMGLVKISSEL